jgi:hypothetical protein
MPEKLPRKWAEKWEVSRTMFNEAGVSVCVIPQRKPKTSIKKTAKRSNDYITAGRIVRFKKAG